MGSQGHKGDLRVVRPLMEKLTCGVKVRCLQEDKENQEKQGSEESVKGEDKVWRY